MTAAAAVARLMKAYGPQGWWPIGGVYRSGRYLKPPPRERFEICAGAILTQNTNWANAEKALASLGGELEAERIAAMPLARLERKIRSSGYFRVKAKKLKGFARWWKRGETPDRKSLLELWGVGPETADSMLLYGWAEPVFVVDAYTRRIGARVGWFGSKAGYDEVQGFFMKGLPATARCFNEAHALFVKLAKEHCRTTPDCTGCPLRTGCREGRKR